ncbi:hypothetical protein AAZX31_19G234200 [Glycine max]
MKNKGFSPDIVTYNILIGSLCSRGMLHAALEFKNQLLKENFNPTVVTYTILIEATLLQGGIDEAIKLLDEMFEINLQPDVFPYNSIIICAEKVTWIVRLRLLAA